MPNLSTTYLGLKLEHPVVASASPLSYTLDGIRRLEDCGASAIVMFSLFEEQIRSENEAYDYLTRVGADSGPEATAFFPMFGPKEVGPDAYLELIRRAKEAVAVPVIASLNGVTDSGWTSYARLMQEAGADAIELNVFYVPADVAVDGRAVEQRYVDIAFAVRRAVSIPLAVKLSPFFSSIGDLARRVVVAGADGLVLFNRFYQPDFDLEHLDVVPTLQLSSRQEIRLPLLWISILRGRLPVALAATTGVETRDEIVKYLLAGADVVMTTSALLRHGPEYLRTLITGLRDWLHRREYLSVAQMKGSLSQQKVAEPEAFERANYVRILQGWK
jgi:dihydroorotate dehydrogenase (fumarate)